MAMFSDQNNSFVTKLNIYLRNKLLGINEIHIFHSVDKKN